MTIPRFFASAGARPGEVAVTRAKAFEAAHAFRDPSFGEHARVHGHNYVLTATMSGAVDPRTGMLVDFRELDRVLADAVAPLDHRRLDVEYAPIEGCEPGVEALARALRADLESRLRAAIPRARLAGVRVAETEDLWADDEGGGRMELTRAYSFSAAHRLADPARGEAENRAIYGKCANPQPHGHDYRFEVTVAGEPDPRTGLVADLGALDRVVEREVVAPFDHRYLNAEIPPFDHVVPTAERIAERIWELLAPSVAALARIVVYETPRSAFTYRGPSEERGGPPGTNDGHSGNAG